MAAPSGADVGTVGKLVPNCSVGSKWGGEVLSNECWLAVVTERDEAAVVVPYVEPSGRTVQASVRKRTRQDGAASLPSGSDSATEPA